MKTHFVNLLTSRLLAANYLLTKSFAGWAWLPGTGFQEDNLWWGKRKKRIAPHEGIDYVLYRDKEGKINSLAPGLLIPSLFSGEIVQVHQDFLACSLYIRHDQFMRSDAVLYTVYGHIQPQREGCVGQQIVAAETVAVLAKYPQNNTVPLHLHFSAAWISQKISPKQLNWQLLADRSLVTLIDPWTTCPRF